MLLGHRDLIGFPQPAQFVLGLLEDLDVQVRNRVPRLQGLQRQSGGFPALPSQDDPQELLLHRLQGRQARWNPRDLGVRLGGSLGAGAQGPGHGLLPGRRQPGLKPGLHVLEILDQIGGRECARSQDPGLPAGVLLEGRQ